MKPKSIIIGIIVVLCAGLGIYALVKSRGPASTTGDEATVSSIVSVQTSALKRMTLHRYINGYGTVEPAPATADKPAADAPLAAPTAGVVAQVNVAEGQQVTNGQVLMKLNSGTATADYAEQQLARQRKLYAEHNTSLKMLQDAETQLALLRITAPLAGIVVSVNVKLGAAVDANTVVAEVMDLHRLVVKTDVPESEANELKVGETLQVLTQPPVAAAVSFVSPTVDTNSSTVRAWAALPPDSGLRPGQFVPLQIVTAVHTNCLAAPEESVVTDVAGRSVMALVQGDEATQTPVQTGFHENGWVEIEGNGLKAGDSVVTVGAYGLPDKTKIQVVSPSEGETSTTNSSSQAQ
ncbi:MAG TPA: efflux RND transporter periplasmic adaptor subunit [Candidatus Paceibacterota bacterium]|nr:efflux RND transporter periplasmic adaptor subunit [Candidatus Paceibacterota bacterium]